MLTDKATNPLDTYISKQELIGMQSTVDKAVVRLECTINRVEVGQTTEQHTQKMLNKVWKRLNIDWEVL